MKLRTAEDEEGSVRKYDGPWYTERERESITALGVEREREL